MLEEELLSHPSRMELLRASLDQALAEVDQADKRIKELETLVNARRREEAQKASEAGEAAKLAAAGKHPLLKIPGGGKCGFGQPFESPHRAAGARSQEGQSGA